MTTQTLEPIANPLVLPVDAEHDGIRFLGCSAFLAMSVIGFLMTSLLIPEAPFLAVIVGLLSGGGVTYATEKLVRPRWPSGRELALTDTHITLQKHQVTERQIDPHQHVNTLFWRFEVKRSGRVPKGWVVIAFALEQEESRIPLYTFAPRTELENLPLADSFTVLQKEEKTQTGKPITDFKLAGIQRRLHDAEKDRSFSGAELTLDQFKTLITHLQTEYPKWMPQN